MQLGGVRCPVPVRVSDSVRSVPSAFATIKGLKGLKSPKGILADNFDDSSDIAFAATPSTQPIVATLPLLLKIYM